MAEYKEVKGTIAVPANTGVEGFLHTIKTLMARPRLQSFQVDSKGTVSFRRFVLKDEQAESAKDNYGVSLEHLQPYYVVRNALIRELTNIDGLNAASVVGVLMARAARDDMQPLSFLVNPTTLLWRWYKESTGHEWEEQGVFFGLPVLTDRYVPEEALLLCAGYGRDAAFVDTQISYKAEIPLLEEST